MLKNESAILSQGKEIADHPGWNDSLVQLKCEGEISDFTNLPYLGYAEVNGWDAFYEKIINLCEKEKFDLVYFHYYHRKGKPSPRKCMQTLLLLPYRPVIITRSGDPFSDNWMKPRYPEDFQNASRFSDIRFSTQMGKAADKMIKWGAKNVVYTPNSMCQVRFKANQIDIENHIFDFDVVFVGSKNTSRNPLSRNYWAAKKEIDW